MEEAEKPESSAGSRQLRELDLAQPELQASDLRRIIREASQALTFLDAVRLEELAAHCDRLMRDLVPAAALALQARQPVPEMAVFARVLDATRANLDVMRRLRDLREGRCVYALPQTATPETLHGND